MSPSSFIIIIIVVVVVVVCFVCVVAVVGDRCGAGDDDDVDGAPTVVCGGGVESNGSIERKSRSRPRNMGRENEDEQ